MSLAPPMTFRAEDVMKRRAMIDGPMVVFWGQDGEEYFGGRGQLDYGPRPRDRVIDRIRRARTWRITIRIAPPPDVELKQFGQDVARIFGVPYGGDPEDSDRAIWIPGGCKARTASHALGAAGRAVQRLGGLNVGALQVRVEEWQET